MHRHLHSSIAWLIGVLIALSAPAAAAAEAKNVFYAIHFATFADLRSVNEQINALQDKGKLVFWEKTAHPGQEVSYRVYLGRFDRWEEALDYWKRLKAAGAVENLGIHWFTEAAPDSVLPRKGVRGHIRLQPLRGVPTPDRPRFTRNGDGTVHDSLTGLMWPENGWRLDLLSALSWHEAVEKCADFRLGGHRDWRLPTIDEWLSLIDIDNRNPALVEPNPFVNIISHMPYWSASEYTYGKDHTCTQECPLESYTVMLFSGSVNHQKKSERAFVFPVRNIGRP